MKKCIDCKKSKPIAEFYKREKDKTMSYCKICFNQRCIKRWIDRKIKAIVYKGGICVDCNLSLSDSHYSVFEFHHLRDKECDWNKLRLTSWTKICKELDKCVLLCSNCHRMRTYSTPLSGIEPESQA